MSLAHQKKQTPGTDTLFDLTVISTIRIMNNRILLGFCTMYLLISVSFARADIITLRSGERVEGKVLDVTRSEVRIETKVHNIRTTVVYRRALVVDIEYRALPADFWDSGRADDAPTVQDSENSESPEPDSDALSESSETEPPSRRGRRIDPASQYVVIPVEGTIGEQVTAHGLRTALLQTRGRGVRHVVFTVNSPGGYVFEAVQILETLKEFDAELTFHCVIEEGAISAASVFAAGADMIYVRPGSRLGGAVAYTSNNSTGATEVDAKFNSIWSAEVASRAESKGHNGDAFRAMIVVASELWQSDADGSLSARARDGHDTQIDGPTTVLTMSAAQMIRGGMARMVETPIDGMGSLTGVDGWTELRGLGQRAMLTAARERADLKRRFDAAIEAFQRAADLFEQNHPSKVQYLIERSATGMLSMESGSLREWRARTDATVQACNAMLASLKDLATVNARAEKTGAQHLLIPPKLGHERYLEIEAERNKLINQRDRPPVLEMVQP